MSGSRSVSVWRAHWGPRCWQCLSMCRPSEAPASSRSGMVSAVLPRRLRSRPGISTSRRTAKVCPAGSGTAEQGRELYVEKCETCHGQGGEGRTFDRLVGREPREGFPFGNEPSLVRTIGNYWPFATTLYDYTFRAMPFDDPGTLEPNEVYSLTAYLLYLNDIIADDAVMNADTLPQVEMPAKDKFVMDNRRGGRELR